MDTYRAVLEVFKFLTFQEVLEAGRTCELWLRGAQSEELWTQLARGVGVQADTKGEFREALFAATLCVNKKREFGVFNAVLKTWKRVNIEKKIFFHHSRTSLLLPDGLLFICGGTSKHVYTYSLRTTRLCQLPPMLKRRQCPGPAADEDFVYIFGGCHTEVFDSCEKLSLATQQWTAMPNMLAPRKSVKACRLGTKVFLCGGASDCEQYDTVRDEFTWMHVNIPDGSEPRFAALQGSDLLLLTTSMVCRFSQQGDVKEIARHAVDPWFICSGMNAVLLGQGLHYSRNWDTVYCFDVKELSNVQVFPQ